MRTLPAGAAVVMPRNAPVGATMLTEMLVVTARLAAALLIRRADVTVSTALFNIPQVTVSAMTTIPLAARYVLAGGDGAKRARRAGYRPHQRAHGDRAPASQHLPPAMRSCGELSGVVKPVGHRD